MAAAVARSTGVNAAKIVHSSVATDATETWARDCSKECNLSLLVRPNLKLQDVFPRLYASQQASHEFSIVTARSMLKLAWSCGIGLH